MISYPIFPYDASFEAAYETKILMRETVEKFPALKKFGLIVAPNEFKGLILVDLRETLKEIDAAETEHIASFIKKVYSLKREEGALKYLLKLVTLDYLVETDVDKIREKVASYRNIINDKWRLKVRSRGVLVDKRDFIEKVADEIDAPVDLENPTFIIHIEILGDFTGIYLERTRSQNNRNPKMERSHM